MILIWNLDLKKCAKIIFKRGKQTHPQNYVTDINREVQALELLRD